MNAVARTHAGVPAGGQFTARNRTDSDVVLALNDILVTELRAARDFISVETGHIPTVAHLEAVIANATSEEPILAPGLTLVERDVELAIRRAEAAQRGINKAYGRGISDVVRGIYGSATAVRFEPDRLGGRPLQIVAHDDDDVEAVLADASSADMSTSDKVLFEDIHSFSRNFDSTDSSASILIPEGLFRTDSFLLDFTEL
jgi:hypothetical protein